MTKPAFLRSSAYAALAVTAVMMLTPLQAQRTAQTDSKAPVRTTQSGAVRGASQGGIQRFYGMPFAQAPTGNLRWAAPRPATPWAGTRPAVTKGSECVQLPQKGQPVIGSEDCLYLDVYAPANAKPGAKLPVFVYLYGGVMVTGASQDIDASKLAERENIIVVVPNYRLGVFGFLTLPELDRENANGTSGNWALLDQKMALEWVRDNIDGFGGDPAEVTIGGQSAGAYSVGMHMLLPESHGLFKRGIVMGMPFLDDHSIWNMPGYVTNQWEQADGPSSMLPMLANCDDAQERVTCLRAQSTQEIAAAAARKPGMRWSPTVDGVLRQDVPTRMVARGAFKSTPLLIGTNHNEGGLNTLRLKRAVGGRALTPKDYADTTLSLEDGQAMLAHNPVTNFASPEEAVATTRSRGVNCRLLRTAATFAKSAPVYTYLFADEDAPSHGLSYPDYKAGSYHAAEIQYVFGSSYPQDLIPGPAKFSPAQLRLSERIMDYWGAFIRDGRPADPAVWPEFGSSGTTLKLLPAETDQPMSTADFRKDYDCEFWDGFDNAR